MTNHIQDDLERLPDPVRWSLEKADGYMDLRMWDQALAELDRIEAEYRDSIAFRHFRLRLAIEQKDWETSERLARALHGQAPEEPAFWVELAYVTRRVEGVQAARTILNKALDQFPKVAVIPFNLACYECQLGDINQARAYLDTAFQLEPGYRRLALEDKDLEPLWGELESDS